MNQYIAKAIAWLITLAGTIGILWLTYSFMPADIQRKVDRRIDTIVNSATSLFH